MKKNLVFMMLVTFMSSFSQGSQTVACTIEGPCNWLEPIPGISDSYLGYCVDSIRGDQSELLVARSDGKGNALPGIVLKVSRFDEKHIFAANEDETYSLRTSPYGQIFAGGLVVKTERDPDGLGFFLSCEVSRSAF